MHLLTWDVVYQDRDGNLDLRIRLQRSVNSTAYAILSHVWGKDEDEVSYEDMVSGHPEAKRGYRKLFNCCKQAHQDGLSYAWVDTCCINKTSSAELSEAITSMYAYYERSSICYAFLDDVVASNGVNEAFLSFSFSKSNWFTRGWTLQELIAPRIVRFFDRSWSLVGAKTDSLISEAIERITKVDVAVLNIRSAIKVTSIAKKMSWAAGRKTKRIEDRAYSLMGLFGVYMAPIYGEGAHAFIRLQEAILKVSNDHSIFAWTSPPDDSTVLGLEQVSTMLALSPDQFQHSSHLRPLAQDTKTDIFGAPQKLDYTLTNSGLSIRLPLQRLVEFDGLYAAFLACTEGVSNRPLAILLSTTARTPHNHFWRTNSNKGPIERYWAPWFPQPGRHHVATQDIYVLPRFTSLSEDNIEPMWQRVPGRISRSPTEAEASDLCLAEEVIHTLRHIPDPSFKHLESLRNARHLVATSTISELLSMTTEWGEPLKILPPRTSGFYGRSSQLKQLHSAFSSYATPGEIAHIDRRIACPGYVISGIGPVGKTSLALEFCHTARESQLIESVFWVRADSPRRIMASYKRIAIQLGLAGARTPDDVAAFKFMSWLHQTKQYWTEGMLRPKSRRWLLVFDNVTAAKELDEFWPQRGPGAVLITTRSPDGWEAPFISEHLDLQQPAFEESAEFLLRNGMTASQTFQIAERRAS